MTDGMLKERRMLGIGTSVVRRSNKCTHSENMMMYWLMASSTPAAHPSTNSMSRIIIGGLRSG
jgi:hypothetical protein